MVKGVLHLSIEPELISLAKSMGINLSQEFEDWIRIRMNQVKKNDIQKTEDEANKLIAQHRIEIMKLESEREKIKEQELNKDLEKEVIDFQIDNIIENKGSLTDIDPLRFAGLQFVFKKKFGKILNSLEAKDLIEKRIKERGLV